MIKRTVSDVQRFLDDHLWELDIPEGYLGDEIGSMHKGWDSAKVRMVICTPFDYKQFFGNQGVPLIYRYINEHGPGDWLCERFYHPRTPKDVKLFRREGIPYFGIESKHPLRDFDIVGITVPFSPQHANFWDILRTSGIPPRVRDREDMKEPWPMVWMGGQCFGNPVPWGEMADVVWIGELEDEPGNPGLHEVFRFIEPFIQDGSWYEADGRENALRLMAGKFDFLYVSRFVEWEYSTEPPYRVTGWKMKYPELPDRVVKRWVRDLDKAPALLYPIVSYHGVEVIGQAGLETARSCQCHCSFCASTYRYSPYRERDVDLLVEQWKEIFYNSGFYMIGPTTLEFGTHSKKKEILKRILEEVADRVNCPSVRVDTFADDPGFGLIMHRGGKDQITLAFDAYNQKLRNVVNKGINEGQILKAVEHCIRAGFRRLKIYVVCDLPGETRKDTDEMLALAAKIDDMKRSYGSKMRIRWSFTPLNVQAWTPLQWSLPQIFDIAYSLEGVYTALRDLGQDYVLGKKQNMRARVYMEMIEIGDAIAGRALVDILEQMDVTYHGGMPGKTIILLEAALEKYGRSVKRDYFRERGEDELFPWDVIDLGVKKDFLLGIWRRIKRVIAGDESAVYESGFLTKHGKCGLGCDGCGACDEKNRERMKEWDESEDMKIRLMDINMLDESSVMSRYRLEITRDELHRFITSNYWHAALRRASWQAGYPVSKYSIQVMSEQADWQNWTCGTDYVEVGFTEQVSVDPTKLVADLNRFLSPGFMVTRGLECGASMSKLNREDTVTLYEVMMPGMLPVGGVEAIRRYGASEEFIIRKKERNYRAKDPTIEDFNIKPYVRDVWLAKRGRHLVMKMLLTGKVSPYEVYAGIMGLKGKAGYRGIARSMGTFIEVDGQQADFFRSDCEGCGVSLPDDVVGFPWLSTLCGRCEDERSGNLLT